MWIAFHFSTLGPRFLSQMIILLSLSRHWDTKFIQKEKLSWTWSKLASPDTKFSGKRSEFWLIYNLTLFQFSEIHCYTVQASVHWLFSLFLLPVLLCMCHSLWGWAILFCIPWDQQTCSAQSRLWMPVWNEPQHVQVAGAKTAVFSSGD